jgi:hypothetical protein
MPARIASVSCRSLPATDTKHTLRATSVLQSSAGRWRSIRNPTSCMQANSGAQRIVRPLPSVHVRSLTSAHHQYPGFLTVTLFIFVHSHSPALASVTWSASSFRHTGMVASSPPDAICDPSGDQTRPDTAPRWPSYVARSAPVCESQRCTCPGAVEARQLPSGDQATDQLYLPAPCSAC